MAQLKRPKHDEGPVNAGEKRLQDYLVKNLPDDYLVVPNCNIAVMGSNHVVKFWEYDAIVITPHAIFHLENKDWGGNLEGDDMAWFRNGQEIANPFKTAELKSKILRSKIKNVHPDWETMPIITVITLSNPRQSKFGLDPYCDTYKQTFVLSNDELKKFLTNPDSVGRKERAIALLQKDVANYLSGESVERQKAERKYLLEYKILETLQETDSFTEFLCEPRFIATSKYIIREYPLDKDNMTDEQLRQLQMKVQNASMAQEKMEDSPFIVKTTCRMNDDQTNYYEISRYQEESTLRSKLRLKTFKQTDKINIILDVARALKIASDHNIFHRNVCPENINVYDGGKAALANFGVSWFLEHQDLHFTVSFDASQTSPYTAPELLDKDVYSGSDLYSLGVIFYELMVGKLPFDNVLTFKMSMGGELPNDMLPSHQNKDLPTWMDDVVRHTITTDIDNKRWNDAGKMIDFITNVVANEQSSTSGTSPISIRTADDHISLKDLKPGMKVTPSMTLHEELGKGGFGRVFKVWHDMQKKYYAIKIFDRDASIDNALNEFDALKELNHDNIVKFVFNDRTNQDMFYTLMELLDGENLQPYVDGDLRLPVDEVFKMATQILDALIYMQDKVPPVFHRDIKPSNIMWSNRKVYKLIDFNISTTTDDKAFAGTFPYMAPDLVKSSKEIDWDCSADTFALGITIYQLLAHAYPWPGSSYLPNVHKQPTDIRDYNNKLTDKMADFVMKSIITDKTKRFSTAKEMQDALQEIGVNGMLKDTNKFISCGSETGDVVEYINSLYSQSHHGNSGTRAGTRASAFDTLTYTETLLDKELIKDIEALKYKLIVITGNAGDGKTAFIHRIEERGTERIPYDSNNGSEFYLSGVRFKTNYDGSQDEDDKGNAQVLEDFLKPFYNLTDYTHVSEGRVIAINEGRLVDFLSTRPELRPLQDNIEEYFYQEGHTSLLPGLMVINLNLRSVTARTDGGASLLAQQVKRLTRPDLWTKCEGCPIADRCFINYNVETFQDESAGDEIINRLEWLVRTIVYKKELHITMRDMRSMIAWMLTRDYSCEEVKRLVVFANEENLQEYYWQYYYFNLTAPVAYPTTDYFGLPTLNSQDRLVRLLRETDVAGVPLPAYDRDLYYKMKKTSDYLVFSHRKHSLLADFNNYNIICPAYEVKDNVKRAMLTRRHKTFIRHQYFEGASSLDFKKRLPYRHITDFEKKLSTEDAEGLKATMQDLALAISSSEGCNNPKLTDGYMLLASSNVEDPISKSYRRFSLDEFELFVNKTDHLIRYVEYEPDSLTFRHKYDKFIQLTVSLDLFEMLQYIKEGFSPSVNDLRGKFIELQIFKNLLESKTYTEILVTKNNRKYIVIRLDEDKHIVIEPLNA